MAHTSAADAVQVLYDALGGDLYPPEIVERLFGIQMLSGPHPASISDVTAGVLVYDCWKSIFDCSKKEKLEIAFSLGILPQYFQSEVLKYHHKFVSANGLDDDGVLLYMTKSMPELIRRDFVGIPWDLTAHRLLKKSVKTQPAILRPAVTVLLLFEFVFL